LCAIERDEGLGPGTGHRTRFGSVSADSPAVATSSSVHGPYEMDVEFLNRLGNTYFNLGPDVVTPTSISSHFNLGPDAGTRTPASTYFNLGPYAGIRTFISAYISHGPDVVEQTASAYINHGPEVVEQTASAFLYNFHGPDTTEWIG